jgi:predicted amidophosphoribosyltransferase
VQALWLYAGAVADAIAAAKRSGRPLPMTQIAGVWRHLVTGAMADCGADRLCAIAPQRARLIERGWHLPDQLAALASQPRIWALQRTDRLAPRRLQRAAAPQFSAGRGTARILLVDDVVTTGATLDAAATALSAAGWQVAGAVVLADARPAQIAAACPAA